MHDDFLVKPLDLSVLLASVQRQLQLTWLYKREAMADLPENGGAAAQLSDTAARHIEDLWQLGLIGHVRGIHAKLRDLDAEHPRNQTLAARAAFDGRSLRYVAIHEYIEGTQNQ